MKNSKLLDENQNNRVSTDRLTIIKTNTSDIKHNQFVSSFRTLGEVFAVKSNI